MAENDDADFLSLLDGKSPSEHGLSQGFGLNPEGMNEFLATTEANSVSQQQEQITDSLFRVAPEVMAEMLENSEEDPECYHQGQINASGGIQETETGTEENFRPQEESSDAVDLQAVQEEIRRILRSTTENAAETYDRSSQHVSRHIAESPDLVESSGPQSSEIQHQAMYQNEIRFRSHTPVTGNDESGNADSLEWLQSLLEGTPAESSGGNVQQETLAPQGRPNIEFALPRGRQLISQDEALSSGRSRPTQFSAGLNKQYDIRDDGSSIHGIINDFARFSTWLTQLRQSEASYDDICNDIDVPILPLLDEEIDSNFQRDETELIKIPWTLTTSKSPTLGRIAKDVRPMEQMPMILAEDLFNHLFQLSRRSFLQREEGVHLELWTHLMSVSGLMETMNLEKQAKQVIKWMETTFVAANLPLIIQKLVKSINDHDSIRYIMEKAKELYNQDQIEMTPLGSLFSLMSAHGGVLESNKDIAKRKKELDKNVKKMKGFLAQRGLQVPKARFGRKATRDAKAVIAREKGMIKTYAATRWLIVGCGDAHYAYQCAVVKAAKESEAYIKAKRNSFIQSLVYELTSLSAIMESHEENGEILPGELVARRVELVNQIDAENLRQLPSTEYNLLCVVADTMSSLGKISVNSLFVRMGGRIPSCFRKLLLETESKVEKLRGVGSMEGMVISDIAAIRDSVERELLKSERSKELLERKREQVRECQQVIRAVFSANPNLVGASFDDNW